MLVRAAKGEEDHVHEVREGAVDVAHVAVVDLASLEGTCDVLEDPLVATQGRQRSAMSRVGDPEERRQRDNEGRDNRPQRPREREATPILSARKRGPAG